MDHQVIEYQIERRRKRRRGIIALLSALAALTLGAGTFSLAQFTDQDTSTWSFTAGSINIDAEATVGAAVTGIMPGDTFTEDLVVWNLGTEELRYSMTTVATNPLGLALELTVRTEDVDGACDDFDGALLGLASQTLNGAAWGDNTMGQDTDDQVLAGLTSQTLCFRVHLPLGANTNLQGTSSTATFTFDAEQTINNP
jgi:Camelysin metallo-endopeptidase